MNYLPSRSALFGVLGSAAALSVLATVALAGEPGTGAPAAKPAATGSDVTAVGMVATRDAETGALRTPTAKEAAALRASATATRGAERTAEPVVRHLANGTLALTLDPSMDVFSVATKGPDGKIHTACVPGDKVAAVMEAAQQNKLTTKKETLDEK